MHRRLDLEVSNASPRSTDTSEHLVEYNLLPETCTLHGSTGPLMALLLLFL